MKPKLVKRIAHQPPGTAAPAPAPDPPPPPDPIPLDRTHADVNANVKRERRRLIAGLAPRAEHLCEACRQAQAVRSRIEAHLRQSEQLVELLERALNHPVHPDAAAEWHHEGIDPQIVSEYEAAVRALIDRFSLTSDF